MDGTCFSAPLTGGYEPALTPPRRVLTVASEIYPLAKTGGLADVCAGLPRAMAEAGADLRLLMPAYPSALAQAVAPRPLIDLGSVLGVANVRVLRARTPDSALPLWLLDCPSLFARDGGPYLDRDGREWEDNALRFAVLCHAAARLALDGEALLGWRPDIVHCHDWHAGLVPLLLADAARPAPRTVFTIHNAAFQGNVPLQQAAALGVGAHALGADGAEFYGQLSFLKAGIRYADQVTTVSPTYARELLTAEFGCGMQGLLRERGSAVSGILNGIDAAVWDPASDPHLPSTYSPQRPLGKAACKQALQAELGLDVDASRPLALMLSRLTGQKMADVVLAELPALLTADPTLQFALHGCGDRDIETAFVALGEAFAGRVAVRIGYDEALAHRLHAGADLLLHGSRFEPCGLVQMYAMRYGTLPVVSRVGGLADTVRDADERADGNGFVFDGVDGDALRAAVLRALRVRREQPQRWARLQVAAMTGQFDWRCSARDYLALFTRMLGEEAARLGVGADPQTVQVC